ncbi:hypothetical protein FXO38_26521 [Capsicum annuum]|nr:hypothetical protein FXO38_26521 [Capsicum annuum]
MTNKYRVYNRIKKFLDRNCNLVLDCPVRCRDLNNILKAHFKTYMAYTNDMVVPNIPNLDSNTDSTIIRNSREVCSRGRPQINRNRSLHPVKMLGDEDLDTMIYMRKDKAVKVGVAVGSGVVEVVEEVGCVVVEEVEAMM